MSVLKMLTLDAERATLARMMRSASERQRLMLAGVDPYSFRATANQEICAAMLAVHRRGEEVDVISVGEELRRRGDLVLGFDLLKVWHALDGELLLDDADLVFLRSVRISLE